MALKPRNLTPEQKAEIARQIANYNERERLRKENFTRIDAQKVSQEEWNEAIWNELADEKHWTIFGWFSLEEIKQIIKPCKANSKPIDEEIHRCLIVLDYML